MFKKPFNIKSNTNLRNSDCRKLLKRVEPGVAEALPKKAIVSHVKITTFNEALLNVYLFDRVPLFFDDNPDGYLVPTVYAAWAYPECCPILVVHQEVFGYLENGADLMLQGVIVNSNIQLPTFDRGVPVAIATLGKDGKLRGPLAIGASIISSEMMQKCGMQGKGVQIMHIFRDHLWEMGPRTQPPLLDPNVLQKQLRLAPEIVDEIGGLSIEENAGSIQEVSTQSGSSQLKEKDTESGDVEEEVETETAEDLLMRCFLAGLRYRLGKSATLPYDVGQFYSCCLLKCVPEGKRLDVKKTKFKKFANFLIELNKDPNGPLLKITAKGKGVDVISEVNWDHPLLTHFKLTNERTKDDVSGNGSAASKGPQIKEYYAITDALVPLLRAQTAQYNRGDLLNAPEVREIVTAYVKKENLNEGKMVKMDPLLSSITGISQEKTDWNMIIQKW
ncbi:unnamed protein product, partial [Mesorhabditis belari]|uniref:Eukaryotic translation initiation factor 2D n=1 Tax=Mesorhabditis belari TaxID=2138241 RepID=A0AAF3FJ57_9BILA